MSICFLLFLFARGLNKDLLSNNVAKYLFPRSQEKETEEKERVIEGDWNCGAIVVYTEKQVCIKFVLVY